MRRHQVALSSSSDDSDGSDLESCFDTEDEVGETDSDTNPTDVDTDIEGEDEADVSWITEEDKDRQNTTPIKKRSLRDRGCERGLQEQ